MNNPPYVAHPTHKVGLTHVETGTIFPDQFHDWPIYKVDNTTIGSSKPIALNQSEFDRLTRGTALIYIAGTVNYFDEFGLKHWVRFCTSLPTAIDSQAVCPKYNKADSNY
jgi:hypothetical protein